MKERKKGKERGFHQSGLMFIKGKKKKLHLANTVESGNF